MEMNMIKLLSNVILLKSVNHVYIKCWSVLKKIRKERVLRMKSLTCVRSKIHKQTLLKHTHTLAQTHTDIKPKLKGPIYDNWEGDDAVANTKINGF